MVPLTDYSDSKIWKTTVVAKQKYIGIKPGGRTMGGANNRNSDAPAQPRKDTDQEVVFYHAMD